MTDEEQPDAIQVGFTKVDIDSPEATMALATIEGLIEAWREGMRELEAAHDSDDPVKLYAAGLAMGELAVSVGQSEAYTMITTLIDRLDGLTEDKCGASMYHSPTGHEYVCTRGRDHGLG